MIVCLFNPLLCLQDEMVWPHYLILQLDNMIICLLDILLEQHHSILWLDNMIVHPLNIVFWQPCSTKCLELGRTSAWCNAFFIVWSIVLTYWGDKIDTMISPRNLVTNGQLQNCMVSQDSPFNMAENPFGGSDKNLWKFLTLWILLVQKWFFWYTLRQGEYRKNNIWLFLIIFEHSKLLHVYKCIIPVR